MQFVIPLASAGEPLFKRIYTGLRTSILSGTLPSRGKLPSTRELARQLGVSRTVVVLAYEQLLAEGVVSGRIGSGTYVAHGIGRMHGTRPEKPIDLKLASYGSSAEQATARVSVRSRRRPALPYDFAYAGCDAEGFPLQAWNRILLRCARKTPMSELDCGLAAGAGSDHPCPD